MMKAAPAARCELPRLEFLFQFLIVPPDAPPYTRRRT